MNAPHAIEPVRVQVSDTWTGARITDCERISVQNSGSVFTSIRWRWGSTVSPILAVLAPGSWIDLVPAHPEVYLEAFGTGGEIWINGTRGVGCDRG